MSKNKTRASKKCVYPTKEAPSSIVERKTKNAIINHWVEVAGSLSKPQLYNRNFPHQERIPFETFANICSHLSPTDLLSMRLTCKYFNELLQSPTDAITQDIWRISRTNHCPYQKMPPPEGMSEQSYTKIFMYEEGCQLCGSKDETPKIYWVAQVRCCKNCLKHRVVSEPHLRITWQLPGELISALTKATEGDPFCDGLSYYWISCVSQILNESITRVDKSWLAKKRILSKRLSQEIAERERQDDFQLKAKIDEQMEQLNREVTKIVENNIGLMLFTEKEVQDCLYYEDICADIRSRPFAYRDWDEITVQLKNHMKLQKLRRASVSASSTRTISDGECEELFDFDSDEIPRDIRTGYNLRKCVRNTHVNSFE